MFLSPSLPIALPLSHVLSLPPLSPAVFLSSHACDGNFFVACLPQLTLSSPTSSHSLLLLFFFSSFSFPSRFFFSCPSSPFLSLCLPLLSSRDVFFLLLARWKIFSSREGSSSPSFSLLLYFPLLLPSIFLSLTLSLFFLSALPLSRDENFPLRGEVGGVSSSTP